jgi:hypothetical protein
LRALDVLRALEAMRAVALRPVVLRTAVFRPAVFRPAVFRPEARAVAALGEVVRAAAFAFVAAEVRRAARFAVLFRLAAAADVRRPAALFFLAVRFRPAPPGVPDRAVLRLRLLVRGPFRFAITRSFPVASELSVNLDSSR